METSSIDQNICILNDTYNANPKSMEIALKTLARLKGKGRGIAVLGDMLELGEASKEFHQQLGSLIKEVNLDAVFLMGTYAEVVAESAIAQGVSEEAIYIGKTHEQIAQKLTKKVDSIDLQIQADLPPNQGIFYNGQIFDSRTHLNQREYPQKCLESPFGPLNRAPIWTGKS